MLLGFVTTWGWINNSNPNIYSYCAPCDYRIDSICDLLIMPRFDQYYIVEFRMPIKIDSVSSVQEAVSRAKQMCENQFGFKPDNWNARVFEYSTGLDVTGHVKEYFYNPNSSSYREITKNTEYFNDLVKKGMTIEQFEKGIIRGDIANGASGG